MSGRLCLPWLWPTRLFESHDKKDLALCQFDEWRLGPSFQAGKSHNLHPGIDEKNITGDASTKVAR